MAKSNGGLSWSEQWGSRNSNEDVPQLSADRKSSSKKHKKMQDVKAAASVGISKAKVVASAGAEKAKVVASVGAEKAKVGALKVKSGTVTGMKWIKEQYAKRTKK